MSALAESASESACRSSLLLCVESVIRHSSSLLSRASLTSKDSCASLMDPVQGLPSRSSPWKDRCTVRSLVPSPSCTLTPWQRRISANWRSVVNR